MKKTITFSEFKKENGIDEINGTFITSDGTKYMVYDVRGGKFALYNCTTKTSIFTRANFDTMMNEIKALLK